MISVEDKAVQKRPWSVLHVVANHEKQVVQHLAARSLEHYLPLYSEQSRWTDRTVTVERPLFAGYVFVRFSPPVRTTVQAIPSVLRLLGDGQREMVSATEIDRIREGLEYGYALRPHPGIAEGTRVRVGRGIFKGAEGIITKFCKKCKVVMTLQATGQHFTLEISMDDIEVLHSGQGRTSEQIANREA
jgi:transcription antitermination factor NusG